MRFCLPLLLLLVCCLTARGSVPPEPYESFRVTTGNTPAAEIAGWVLPADDARGTIFLAHGYGNGKDQLIGWHWIRDWNVVLFDFREHGESTTTTWDLSSLGYHEIWDFDAVVDHAERIGLPQPYVIYGRSLGAATGLRFASMDRRISGVMAMSPFRNALRATQQIGDYSGRYWPARFLVHKGYRQMLSEVDIPTAVAERNDLRIWIMFGEHDCFPREDQEAILAASASPAGLKRLVMVPGGTHSDSWQWQGDAKTVGHDDFVRQFLEQSQSPQHAAGAASDRRTWHWVLAAIGALGIAGWWRRRIAGRTSA